MGNMVCAGGICIQLPQFPQHPKHPGFYPPGCGNAVMTCYGSSANGACTSNSGLPGTDTCSPTAMYTPSTQNMVKPLLVCPNLPTLPPH